MAFFYVRNISNILNCQKDKMRFYKLIIIYLKNCELCTIISVVIATLDMYS